MRRKKMKSFIHFGDFRHHVYTCISSYDPPINSFKAFDACVYVSFSSCFNTLFNF